MLVIIAHMKNKPDQLTELAIQYAIFVSGGQREFIEELREINPKIDYAHIWNWIKRDKKIPPEYVFKIEEITEGKFTTTELRPDIFKTQESKK